METNERPTTPSKYEGLGVTIAAKLIIGFQFGIGVILGFRMVDNLNHCIEVLMNNK